jgi:hypothetical protein
MKILRNQQKGPAQAGPKTKRNIFLGRVISKENTHSKRKPQAYLSLKFGFRFSTKAAIPSF